VMSRGGRSRGDGGDPFASHYQNGGGEDSFGAHHQAERGSDPFAAHHQMMRSMMGGMMGGGMMGGGMMGGGLFGGGLMQQMMQSMNNAGGDDFFGAGGMDGGMGGMSSFSSSFSSSSMGHGQPHVVQYSSSTTVGPNGVQETKKNYRDSRSGEQRMQHERTAGEKTRRVTKTRNTHTGEESQVDTCLNMDEAEAANFGTRFSQPPARGPVLQAALPGPISTRPRGRQRQQLSAHPYRRALPARAGDVEDKEEPIPPRQSSTDEGHREEHIGGFPGDNGDEEGDDGGCSV